MHILIIGCGYAGVALGAQLVAKGHEVWGMRRSKKADTILNTRGISPVHADISRLETLKALPRRSYDIVINLASSSRGGLEDYQRVYLTGTRNILEWLEGRFPALFIYTSSTSVYGQNDGSWVTEESATEPESPTSRVLLETERELLSAFHTRGFLTSILRVAGIYGPDRGHLFRQFLEGTAQMREDGRAFINMVHVADVAGAITHLITRGKAGEVYNVVDDEPVTQLQFFTWLSEKLGRALPPMAPADHNRKRGLTNKRISNDKLTMQTGYQFVYPTFREGYTIEMQRLGLMEGG